LDTGPHSVCTVPKATSHGTHETHWGDRARACVPSPRLVWCVASLGLSSVMLGCDDELKLPTPPDMSALVQAYEHPTGTIDAPRIRAIAMAVSTVRSALATDAPLELARDIIGGVLRLGDFDAGTSSDDADGGATDNDAAISSTADAGDVSTNNPGQQTILGRKFDVAAQVQLHRVCRGDSENGSTAENAAGSGAADTTNDAGTVDMTLTVDNNGLIPTFWGQATRCRRARERIGAELDGALQIRFGTTQERIALRDLLTLGFFVEFAGTATVEVLNQPVKTDVHLDFRVLRRDEIQFNVNLDDGTNVVATVAPLALMPGQEGSMLTVGLLTRDTNWRCDISAKGSEGQCTDALDATKQVDW